MSPAVETPRQHLGSMDLDICTKMGQQTIDSATLSLPLLNLSVNTAHGHVPDQLGSWLSSSPWLELGSDVIGKDLSLRLEGSTQYYTENLLLATHIIFSFILFFLAAQVLFLQVILQANMTTFTRII